MNRQFRIEYCSDLDYEEIVADIYYNGNAICMITQDNGADNMNIKIYQNSNQTIDLPLNDYIEVIQLAKNELIKSRKKPNE